MYCAPAAKDPQQRVLGPTRTNTTKSPELKGRMTLSCQRSLANAIEFLRLCRSERLSVSVFASVAPRVNLGRSVLRVIIGSSNHRCGLLIVFETYRHNNVHGVLSNPRAHPFFTAGRPVKKSELPGVNIRLPCDRVEPTSETSAGRR